MLWEKCLIATSTLVSGSHYNDRDTPHITIVCVCNFKWESFPDTVIHHNDAK